MPIQKSKTKKRNEGGAVASPAPAPRSPSKGARSPSKATRATAAQQQAQLEAELEQMQQQQQQQKSPAKSPQKSPTRQKRGRGRGAFSSGEEDNTGPGSTVQSPVAPPSAPAAVAVNVEVVSSPTQAGKKRGRPKKNEGDAAVSAITGSDTEMASPGAAPPKAKRTPAPRKKKGQQSQQQQEQAEAEAAVAAVEAAAREDQLTRQIASGEVIEEQVVVEEVQTEEGVVVQMQQAEGDLPVLEPDVGAIHEEGGEATGEGMAVAEGQQSDQQENILVMLENGEVTAINPADAVALGLTTVDGHVAYATEGGKIVTEQDLAGQDEEAPYPQDPALLCPICSDSNSGYHYGIFACESCKGFFKRAIQNNRQLRCNFTGNCDITIATRKRCAACRLRKCLLAGMKVEAIRLDRRRGGRSVYIGPPPLPHFRPQRYIKSSTGLKPYRSDQLLQAEASRLLTDVMNLEPQMAEDGEMEPCCEPLLTDADSDPGAAILHLAEHRLYRLIHWARQLPNFSGIETNDQIILLQNSWANLLALFMCWQSTGSEHLVMNFNKVVTRKMATHLGMEEIFERVEAMSEFFNTIGLEREEYVAIRLLILVNPDVDMLGDALKVREFQEQFSEMLLFHTITYRAIESLRFTTILLKIQEIGHIGYLLHDWMLRRYDSYEDANRPQLTGLLVELLKHESVVGQGPQVQMGRLGHLQPGDTLVDDMVGVPAAMDDHILHRHHVVTQQVVTADGEVDTSEVVDNLVGEDGQTGVVVVGQEEEVVAEETPANVVHVVVNQQHGIIVTESGE